MPYITGMPTLGLKLPIRICVLDDTVCVEDADGRRTGYVYWTDDGRSRSGKGRFSKAEAIDQVRVIARAWADALTSNGTLSTGPAPEAGAAAAEPSPRE